MDFHLTLLRFFKFDADVNGNNKFVQFERFLYLISIFIQGIPPPPPAAPAQAQQPGQPHGPPPPPPGPGGVRRVEMFHRHPYRAGERERRHREDALMRLRRKEL